MDYELQIINYESPYYKDVLSLREKVLRLPLGLILSEQDTMEDMNQYIVIAQSNDLLLGCLMIKILDTNRVKFRQMAVLPSHQRAKIGSLMIRYAENFCLLNDYHYVELHARCSALDFYEKNGYKKVGDIFEEVGISHVKMEKDLRAG